MRCLNDEKDMMRRLRGFADRCIELHDEQLAPAVAYTTNILDDNETEDQAFDEVMLKLIPYFAQHRMEHFRFKDLADIAEMNKGELYVLPAILIRIHACLLASCACKRQQSCYRQQICRWKTLLKSYISLRPTIL